MNKTVLIIANDWTTILHFRMEVIKGFLDRGDKVLVALPVCDETKPIEDMGAALINLNVSRHGTNPVEDIKLLKDCIKIIKKYRPDVAITYTVKPNIYGSIACRITKTPYLNNITGIGTMLQSNSPVAKLMLFMMRFAFKKSSCVFFQNKDNHNRFLSEGVINKKTNVEFLPGSGVNLEKFSSCPYDKSITKFVIVSRIRHDKGYAEFFDAAEIVKQKHPQSEFHVIGWYEDEDLKQRINELIDKNVVIYHGALSQEEVFDVVSSCSCLVHPSYHEGMANVILEAAATGRPIIATDICGCKEAVENGRTGFLCDVKNSNSLAEKMEQFIALSGDEREKMGKLGREKMEKEFSRDIVVKKIIKNVDLI